MKPDLLYYFTHIFLRDEVLNNWSQFAHNTLKEGDHIQKSLKGAFEAIKEKGKDKFTRNNIELTENDFYSKIIPLMEGKSIILINLPNPEMVGDGLYTAIVVGEKPRYFVLEMGKKLEDGKIEFYLCEWAEKSHYNLGVLSSASKQELIEKIKSL